jgi:hypothetical protein
VNDNKDFKQQLSEMMAKIDPTIKMPEGPLPPPAPVPMVVAPSKDLMREMAIARIVDKGPMDPIAFQQIALLLAEGSAAAEFVTTERVMDRLEVTVPRIIAAIQSLKDNDPLMKLEREARTRTLRRQLRELDEVEGMEKNGGKLRS